MTNDTNVNLSSLPAGFICLSDIVIDTQYIGPLAANFKPLPKGAPTQYIGVLYNSDSVIIQWLVVIIQWLVVIIQWLVVIIQWLVVIIQWLVVIIQWLVVIIQWLVVIIQWLVVIKQWLVVIIQWLVVINNIQLLFLTIFEIQTEVKAFTYGKN